MKQLSTIGFRLSVLFSAAILSGTIVLAQKPVSQASPAAPVTVVVNIADKHGEPLANVSKESIIVFEKEPTTPLSAEIRPAKDIPLIFAIAIDVSGSNRDKVKVLKESAMQVFESVDSASNHGFLAVFDNDIQLNKKFISRDEVAKALKDMRAGGGSAIFDAVHSTAQFLGKVTPVDRGTVIRRILFVITDGDDNSSGHSREEAIKAALQAHVTIVSIVVQNYSSGDRGIRAMTQIAESTGGRAIVLTSPRDISNDLSRFLDSEFLVTFTPSASASNGKSRSLQIQLADPKQGNIRVPASF